MSENLWGLGVLATTIRWIEELLNTLNGIALMLGAGIAVTDLLISGALSRLSIWFVFTWAISQAVGIEVQLLGSFARARQAQRTGSTGAMIGWLLLGLVLLGATVIAGYTYALVRAENISTEAALAQLGISNFAFLGIRAVLAAGLVGLSGWTRYVDQRVPQTADEAIASIERQMKIDAVKAQRTRQRAQQAILFGKTAAKAAFGREEAAPSAAEELLDSPVGYAPEPAPKTTPTQAKRIFSPAEAKKLRQQKEDGSAERMGFAFISRHPEASLAQIVAATGLGRTTVAKYKKAYVEQRTTGAQ
jgi:hypothetical protein